MASATKTAHENVTPGGDDLRALRRKLGMLVQMTTDYPLECSLGTCEFLFESKDEIQILIESLAEELSASGNAA